MVKKDDSSAMMQFLVVGVAAILGILGSLLGFYVAAAGLVMLGVIYHDHEDYFSPFYHDAGTPASEFMGGAVFFGAGLLGFLFPLIIGLRLAKSRKTG